MVDMKTTRKNSFGRIQVAVLEPNLLPPNLDVVIGDRYFELSFEYERRGFDEHGEEVDFSFGNNGDNGNEDMDHDGAKDNDTTREPKRAKNDQGPMKENEQTKISDANRLNSATMAGMGDLIKAMAEQIIDGACDKLINECCDKVLAEEDDMMVDGLVEDVTFDDDSDSDMFDFSLRETQEGSDMLSTATKQQQQLGTSSGNTTATPKQQQQQQISSSNS